ncbi:MAG: GH116 family glycosyl hydrolase [Pirellulaceae bacterium]
MKWQCVVSALLCSVVCCGALEPAAGADGRPFNGAYTGTHLNRVAFPIGGLGAGMFCLEGTGALSHVSLRHEMAFFHEPTVFAAICVLGGPQETPTARVLEGPIPDWKYFGAAGTGNGGTGTTYGFPRFQQAEFLARFPFATIELNDQAIPLEVTITGWSPFTPPDPDPSSLPIGALEYRFRNPTDQPVRAVFSFNARNFMSTDGNVGNTSIGSIEGGFILYTGKGSDRDQRGAFAVSVLDEPTVVDHCWFRGGWWDALTLAWNNVAQGTPVNNPPVDANAPGASLAVPMLIEPGQEKTVRLLTSWYVPTSQLRFGNRTAGPAFRQSPSRGTASGQQPVSGFLGHGLVNTFDPDGDVAQGTLTSPTFQVKKRYLHFLVGGGKDPQASVNLRVGNKTVQSATGQQREELAWTSFDLADYQGQDAQIEIADRSSGAWGHILADQFVLSDEPLSALRSGTGNAITTEPSRVTLLQDFEADNYGAWVADAQAAACSCASGECVIPDHYTPWYSTQYKNITDLTRYWREHYAQLRAQSELFRDAFYDSTLPAEVLEAAAANLTILKSPTVLRQQDGRLWCFEGCGDSSGCCAGSCTHVWNYAQAICHLFPSLERSMRQTEHHESQDERGRQAFRANLPIAEGGGAFDAADGQLGGIMKVYREWRISGDNQFVAAYWPLVKKSLDYMIAKYDPRHTGLLEEDHHNTYDINYFGPDGHCGSFYLGALTAAIAMGTAVGDEVDAYRQLLEKGRDRMGSELYNGEYFIQIVQKEGLDHNFTPINPADQSPAYRQTAELVNAQGPKYQYGSGCLSDGVLGLWMAAVCGIDDEIVSGDQVRSHLLAVYKYNLKSDLSAHANPQRPTFAMGNDGGLLLCSWPRGDKPLLPFVYSDEVWTGIEYQVASHLFLVGCVNEGLDIVRTCRLRYDGVRRNPFNEYECGHWYARAMSSYALLQGLTGVQYDAVTKTLRVRSQVGDFRSFLSTQTGFGTVEYRDGQATLHVRSGVIPVETLDIAQSP